MLQRFLQAVGLLQFYCVESVKLSFIIVSTLLGVIGVIVR